MLKVVSLAEGDGPMLPPGYVVYFTHLDNYNCAIERERQFVTLFTNVKVVLSACYPSSPPHFPLNKWRETICCSTVMSSVGLPPKTRKMC